MGVNEWIVFYVVVLYLDVVVYFACYSIRLIEYTQCIMHADNLLQCKYFFFIILRIVCIRLKKSYNYHCITTPSLHLM